jgi:hypothetical protein
MEESLKYLLKVHFPGFQETTHPINNPINQVTEGTYKPREWTLAAKVVSSKGVEWAVKTFDPYKAPGPDEICSIFFTTRTELFARPFNKNI